MSESQKFSVFADTVRKQKYAHPLPEGGKESWEQTSWRVVSNVLAGTDLSDELKSKIYGIIARREFMPGGRYLAAAGRDFHQVQNCVLHRADDSREGWAAHMHKSMMALMTGAGIGGVYSGVRARGSVIHRTGGVATGPLALMQMVNEAGRHIRQGGDRRSAIWGGLHWWHPDVLEFFQI